MALNFGIGPLRLRPARMSSNQNVFSAPAELKAITINGAVHVESDEDRKKREERRKNRKSRLVNLMQR